MRFAKNSSWFGPYVLYINSPQEVVKGIDFLRKRGYKMINGYDPQRYVDGGWTHFLIYSNSITIDMCRSSFSFPANTKFVKAINHIPKCKV